MTDKVLREVQDKMKQAADTLLAGRPTDYPEYTRLAGRYAALRELESFLLDPKNRISEDI